MRVREVRPLAGAWAPWHPSRPMKSFQSIPRLCASLLIAGCLVVLAGASGCSGSATRASTGEYIDDGVITTRVKTALLNDDTTPGTAIKVEVWRGGKQMELDWDRDAFLAFRG